MIVKAIVGRRDWGGQGDHGERYCWISEFQSGSLVRRWVAVHKVCAVVGGDVAEAAFLSVGHTCGGFVGRGPADQGSEVLYELGVQAVLPTCTVRCCE